MDDKTLETEQRSNLAYVLAGFMVFLGVAFTIGYFSYTHQVTPNPAQPPDVHLGDFLNIELREAEYVPNKEYQLSLFNTELAGIKPEVQHADGIYRLKFWLSSTSDSEMAWRKLFSKVKSWEPIKATPCVEPVDHSSQAVCFKDAIQFQAMSKQRFIIWLILAAAFLVFFIYELTARNSSMLRDWHPSGAPGEKPTTAALSLSRVQMAFWFALVLLAFLFLWLVTYEIPVIGNSTLALIGIGSGTALGGVLIDDNNRNPAPATKGFWYDLLTNSDGYGFNRVQLFIWTVVLGVMFIAQVMTNLTMPDFDTTLLSLMGISSGTYLGFKISEKKEPPAAANTAHPAGSAGAGTP